MTFPLPVNWADGNAFDATNANQIGSAVNYLAGSSIVAASGNIGLTVTNVASLVVAASTANAGTVFEINAFGTQAATAGTVSYYIALGSTSTVATAATALVAALPVAASGTSQFQGLITVRSIAASVGTCISGGVGVGAGTATSVVVSTGTTTYSVTTSNSNTVYLSVVASAGSHNIEQAWINMGGQ